MENILNNEWIVSILSGVVVSVILFIVGFLIGKTREVRKHKGKNLEHYEFYPFTVDDNNFPNFDIQKFKQGAQYFLKHYDYHAARQLIFIGEQNNVKFHLDPESIQNYQKLFKKYDGTQILDDNNEFLDNYKNIVKLIGRTFRNMGIEILLHNLVNPSKSIVALENPVTGRNVGDGTTVLVLDLKKRKFMNQDKLNYEIILGSRKFKCTTIPIFRKDYGLIGAVCINIDVNYISEEVLKAKENIEY
ncbi:MAG: PAS domain-containing protein, partial [Ignavibacteriales bacterium]